MSNAATIAIANSYRSTIRTIKVLYHTAAFVSLAVLLTTAFTTKRSGYLQLTAPFGTEVATVSGAGMVQDAAAFQQKEKAKHQKQASSEPRPGEKPTQIPPVATGIQLP